MIQSAHVRRTHLGFTGSVGASRCLSTPPAGVFSVVVMVVSVEGPAAEDRLGPPVWCALALGRPVLLLVNKGIKLTEDIAVGRGGGGGFGPGVGA